MSEVSLYIPCFNAAKTIKFCLEGVFSQTYPLKEVLVVDDCSTDETEDVVSKYPVRILRHKENQGLAATRNSAIKNLNTEFVASLDADCVPERDWLACLMKHFVSGKVVGAGGKLLEKHSSSVFDLWREVHMKQYWDEKKKIPSFLFGANTVFRRKTIKNAGLYNEDYYNNYEDVDLCERLKKKGFIICYEPKAIAYHLKTDNINTILNNFWRWNLAYYQKRGWYSDQKIFIQKIKDNIGLANKYIEEDMLSGRYHLIYLDFLLALHHTLKDLEYFITKNKQKEMKDARYSILSQWLSLLDLTFFYHFESTKNNLSTLMPKPNRFLQNFFALNLIIFGLIQKKFTDGKFKHTLSKHLLMSICNISDGHLLNKLMNLGELHHDWNGLFEKKQPNLNSKSLENLLLGLNRWIEDLVYKFPNIIQMIEISAEKTDTLFLFKREEPSYENKN